jgi:hypothetical protein
VLKAVHADLLGKRRAKQGRPGLTAVRAGIAKQMLGLSYAELAFAIDDSLKLRGFCRLSPTDESPKKSALQENIGAIRAETWEFLNKALINDARRRKIEDGRWMRTDTTVVKSNIHHERVPANSFCAVTATFRGAVFMRSISANASRRVHARSTSRPASLLDELWLHNRRHGANVWSVELTREEVNSVFDTQPRAPHREPARLEAEAAGRHQIGEMLA